MIVKLKPCLRKIAMWAQHSTSTGLGYHGPALLPIWFRPRLSCVNMRRLDQEGTIRASDRLVFSVLGSHCSIVIMPYSEKQHVGHGRFRSEPRNTTTIAGSMPLDGSRKGAHHMLRTSPQNYLGNWLKMYYFLLSTRYLGALEFEDNNSRWNMLMHRAFSRAITSKTGRETTSWCCVCASYKILHSAKPLRSEQGMDLCTLRTAGAP